jgi:hypothetical protein
LLSSKKKSDDRWRRQCRLGKYIDPVQYAVPAKFLGRQEEIAVVSIDDSTHSANSLSLVEQINHHRNSIHSLDPTDAAAAAATAVGHVNGIAKPSPEEFENWNEDSVSNERYSEFLSKSRTKTIMSPRNTAASRFQSYDEAVVEMEDPPESEQGRRRKESDQLDLDGGGDLDVKEILKKTDSSEEYSQNIPSSPSSSVMRSESNSGDKTSMTPPVKTRSHRSPSAEKIERKKLGSSNSGSGGGSGRRRSGSTRFKKDAYCDSLLAAATLRSLEGRLEHILSPDLSLGQRSHGDSDTDTVPVSPSAPVPYAFASRVMGLIEIAVTPRVRSHLILLLSPLPSLRRSLSAC